MFHCLDAADYIELLGALEKKEQTYTVHLVPGELLEFQGKLVEAAREPVL